MLKTIKSYFGQILKKFINNRNRKENRHALVGPASLWKMKQQFQIDFLKRQGLLPSHSLLDLGCGTLRGGIPLIQYLNSGNYTGIDIRKEAIAEAEKELQEERLNQKKPFLIHFNQFHDLIDLEKFDMVWAFSVLIHMPDEQVDQCLAFIKEKLKQTGVFYANVNLGSLETENWYNFPVQFKPLTFYQELALKNGLQVEPLAKLAEIGHHSGDQLQDEQMMLAFRHPLDH